MIELHNIKKQYGKDESAVFALDGINVEFRCGEMVAIMGASGSGKSTLLNILGCLDIPTEGEYILDGEPVHSYSEKRLAQLRANKVGFVVQDFALINDLSVLDNVMLPVYFGSKKRDGKKRAKSLLEQLGILEKARAFPHQLSGGQCQRVAIARALVNQPKLLLADEPTGALDSTTGKVVMDLLEDIHRTGTTVILATHSEFVAGYAQRVLRIADGRFVQSK